MVRTSGLGGCPQRGREERLYPDFAAFLVEEGIDSISLNPDSVVQVKRRVAETEGR
jgi:phosphoenolpyruvate synthase/pyruvate phosphate dikinase